MKLILNDRGVLDEGENLRKPVMIIAAIIIVVCTVVFAILAGGNSSAKKIAELLDLGNKYLTEQDYEQAIVAFREVIEIDPKCEEAYRGMADAYIAMDDYESAMDILQQGIGQTESEALETELERIGEIFTSRQMQTTDEPRQEEKVETVVKRQEEEMQEDVSKGGSEEGQEGVSKYEKEEAVTDENIKDEGDIVDTNVYEEYDENENLVKKRYWEEWLQVFVEEIYDEKGQLIIVKQYEADGSSAGSYEYEYDEKGNNVKAITNYVTGGTNVTNYEYDENGNLTKVIYHNDDGTVSSVYEP